MFSGPPDSTPIDPDVSAGLIPDLKTQAELNEFEQANIAAAELWAYKSRLLKKELLSVRGLQALHKNMFDITWSWAGALRRSDTNIGVHWASIRESLMKLCDDTKYQIKSHIYSWDELAVRFHHRLVSIHAFPNGNGRHARLATDLLLAFNHQQPFSWGSTSLADSGEVRNKYISALRDADKGDYKRLIKFAHT